MVIGLMLLGAVVGFWLGQAGWPFASLVLGITVGGLLASQLGLRERLARLEHHLTDPEPAARRPRPDSTNAGQTTTLDGAVPRERPRPAAPADDPSRRRPQPAPVGFQVPPPVRAAVDWLTGGNPAAKLGVVLCFFGIAFLFSYAAEHEWLGMPIEWRLSLVAAGGVAMLLAGWWLRERRRVYGLTLQGGGIGVLYLTLFAALRIFELIPATPGLAGMAVLALAAGVLAALQNAPVLAVLGTAGGFLAPVLSGGESSGPVPLFSWFAVLNLAVAGLAWARNWRSLTLTGFGFTFGLGGLWGWQFYRPEFMASVEPFLVGFMALYALLPLIHARRERRARPLADGGLLFGVPVLYLAYQAEVLAGDGMALALACLGGAFVYLAGALLSRRLALPGLVTQAYAVVALSLATLAVPLALDGRWTAGLWALEGAGLVWLGVAQRQWLMRLAGAALPVAAGLALFEDPGPAPAIAVVNGRFLGGLLVSGAALLAAALLHRGRERLKFGPERFYGPLLTVWGLLWWYGSIAIELDRFVAHGLREPAMAAAVGLTALGGGLVARRAGWWGAAWSLPVTGLLLLSLLLPMNFEPSSPWHWILWAAAFGAALGGLRVVEADPGRGLDTAHATLLWALALLLWAVAGACAAVPALTTAWELAAALAAPSLLLLALGTWRRPAWPLAARAWAWTGPGMVPVPVAVLLALLAMNTELSGDSDPLPYLPLLNPLDVASGLALFGLWIASARCLAGLGPGAGRVRLAAVDGAALFVVTAAAVRAVHHLAGVPWDGDELFRSVAVQSAVSLVWCTAGLALAVAGARGAGRAVWMAGAILLGVVVAKLFLVDLGGTGTLARVVSFIGVGVLLLALGYLAPAPPAQRREREAA